MPSCGSQVTLCNLPIRFDTYLGCEYGCIYCFAARGGKQESKRVRKEETTVALARFIAGERIQETNWCDWDIPLHWGGVSDPFQPYELEARLSFACLGAFAESGYPFVVSSKSILPASEEYYAKFKDCNFVYQVSMVSPRYDKLEPGAPSYNERLAILSKMAKVAKRVIIRAQPYTPDIHADLLAAIPKYAQLGVHGVVVEGMKCTRKVRGYISSGPDYVYPKLILKQRFEEIRNACHDVGLEFYSGENRLREMGDSLTCCGCEGIPGWRVSKCNLNQFLHDKASYRFTDTQERVGTAGCFRTVSQTTIADDFLKAKSFADVMRICERDANCILAFKSK